MFNTHNIPREFDRRSWRKLYRIMRKTGDRGSIVDESRAAERVRMQATIAKCIEDNRIAVVQSGMDCDCSTFCWSSIVENPTLIGLWANEVDAYEWADGPLSIGYCSPSERPEAYSRDLAMEAYEDGHPHIVYA